MVVVRQAHRERGKMAVLLLTVMAVVVAVAALMVVPAPPEATDHQQTLVTAVTAATERVAREVVLAGQAAYRAVREQMAGVVAGVVDHQTRPVLAALVDRQ